MSIHQKNQDQLLLLKDLIILLNRDQFSKGLSVLHGATLGQHIRHILEFYLALFPGQTPHEICYDDRERNQGLEQDPEVALTVLDECINQIKAWTTDRPMDLKIGAPGEEQERLSSSLYRELWYVCEHTTHHMAILKIGAKDQGIVVPEHFGVAESTLRFQERTRPVQ